MKTLNGGQLLWMEASEDDEKEDGVSNSSVEAFSNATPLGIEGGSKFLCDLHYFFAQTDGTYAVPKGVIGRLLMQAKKEIEALQ